MRLDGSFRRVFRDDYVLRILEQLVDVLARIAGHTKRGEYEKAIVEAERAWSELLGVPRELADAMDSPSLARLLRDPDRMRGASRLLGEEARAHQAKGSLSRSAALYRRAHELALEARTTDPQPEDETGSSSSRAASRTSIADRGEPG